MLQLRPTFSESWYRVQALKVRLRPSAQISRQYYRGERWYVVRDPAGNQYHRLSDPAYRFVALLDGQRTINEAWELVGGVMDDDAPTQPEVIQIISQLYSANLIEADVTPDSSTLLKRSKNLEQRRLQQRLMNVLFPRIPIWDPDRFLKRWAPAFQLVYSWPMAFVWIAVVASAVYFVGFQHWDRLWTDGKDAIDPSNWFYLWLVFVGTKFIHEMGHASSCRRFGGECHEMGLMFLVFVPTPYVDASSAWTFPNRWKRILVGAAGMVVELFVASVCAFVWANTREHTLTHQLAYNAMLIASVSTVLFNANPLLRYDGYYMLSDYLEIPNLQKRSQDYVFGVLRRKFFGVKLREPLPSPMTRFWLAFYSVLSGLYRIWIGVKIVLLVAFQVPVLGVLMALGGIATWGVVPVFKAVKYLALDADLHRKRGRAWAWSSLAAAIAVVLLGIVPFPLLVRLEGVVEPVEKRVVRNEAPGIVEKILAVDGQHVAKGDVLLVLRDPVVEHDLLQSKESLRAAEIKYKASLAGSKPSQAQADWQEVVAYQKQVDERQLRVDKLTVRAEIEGQVISPSLVDLPGKYIPRASELMTVAAMDRFLVRSVVTQDDAELIPIAGDKLIKDTRVRLIGSATETLGITGLVIVNGADNTVKSPVWTTNAGGPLAIDTNDPKSGKTVTNQFELRAYLPPGATLEPMGANSTVGQVAIIPGQRAYMRLTLAHMSIGQQTWRSVLQLLQQKASSKWL